MQTDTSPVDPSGTDATLPADVAFDLLCDPRRRYALSFLSRTIGAIGLEDLIAAVVRQDGPVTDTRLAESRLSFHHTHLQKLVDADVVRYDPETNQVERGPAATALEPYLELAFDGGASF